MQALDDFARDNGIPLIPFAKKQHKEEVAEGYRRPFQGTAGLLFIGKAQEKVTTFRTEGRRNAQIGQTYPWRVRTTALVNQYDCYSIDEDFGPFFLKFSSCFPYNAKRRINGHESVKRQRAKEGIAFECWTTASALADPHRLQEIAASLTHQRIDAAPQVAGPVATPVPGGRSAGGLSLSGVDPASGILPDAGARSPRSRADFLRGGPPREPGPGPPRQRPVDLLRGG